ncbi:hypothetical protein [Frankia sp. EAN1pec]|uniref:hypothetical protein n=1 Tax=Parafrankia sp. (strain EAN1pec) TaxID=298653 RepID=UPI00059D74BE
MTDTTDQDLGPMTRDRQPTAAEIEAFQREEFFDPHLVTASVAWWNALWEAAQFRRRYFAEDDLPVAMYEIADRGDVNVVFVPSGRRRRFVGYAARARRLAVLRGSARVYFQPNGSAVWL